MKTKPSILALLAIFAVCSLTLTAIAQITFVETPPRQRPQGQSGLSPEKKKSLSKYGPEDAFPGAREEGSNQGRSTRSGSRQTALKTQPTPTVTPAPSPAITPSTIAAVTPTPVTPKPTSMVATDAASTGSDRSGQVNKSQTSKSGASFVVPAALSLATVLVFGALVYVVGILRKRLKSES